jgi:hypothetical protein
MSVAEVAHRSIAAVRGVSVTYSDGSGTVALKALLGSSTFEVGDGQGGSSNIEARDFIFVASDLVIGGQPVVPASGHTITWGGVVHKLRLPAGIRVYEYSDPEQTVIRAHTLEVAS